MAEWSIKPTWKKSLIEREEYTKDGNRVIIETGWRWGEFTCVTDDDTPPNIVAGDDLWACGYDVEMVECTDGCWEEHDMDECDEDVREWLEEFLEENSHFDLEEHGWVRGDSEMIIDCEPEFEKIGD